MPWPIYVPSEPAPTNTTAQSKPLDKVLNRIARGGFYQVPTAADLPTLLTALAAAGEAAPSTSAPVYADQLDTKTLLRNDGSGWVPVAGSGAWTSFTPTITGPSTVDYGTGATRTGYYTKIGRHVTGHSEIRLGTSPSFGSTADWNLPLPVAPARAQVVGVAWMFDGDTTNYVGAYVATGAGTAAFVRPHGANFTANNTRPFTWAATDQLYLQFSYETAA